MTLPRLFFLLCLLCAASSPALPPPVSPSYLLKGQIVDEDDKPLADVRVGFRTHEAATHTNANGHFELTLNPRQPLTQDNSKTYEWIELDKDGYVGRTVAIKDLAFFDEPLQVKLSPVKATAERAEFTARLGMNHALPSIPAPKDFSLIKAESWEEYFAKAEAAVNNERAQERAEQVVFQAYAPKAAKKLRAAFLLTRHGIGSIDHPRLRAFADRNEVALVSVLGNPVQRGFYPVSLIDEPLQRLGQLLERPELADLPLITFGHSNGTGFSAFIASQRPERVIGWISYHSGASWHLQFPGVEKAPGLVMHGRIDPFFKNGQEATVKHLRQQRGAPVAMMLEANVAHGPVDQNATWDFIAAFAEAAMRIRLNEDGTLRPVVLEQGWLGERYNMEQGGQQALKIAPHAEFTGERTTANWLPDGVFAEVWQTYGKTDPRK